MKKRIVLYSLMVISILPVEVLVHGCNTNQQTTAFKSIYTVEKSSVAAYDAYLDCVISGACPTNGLPQISKKYMSFQASVLVAEDAVQFNTNAVAPANLIVEGEDLVNLINSFTKK